MALLLEKHRFEVLDTCHPSRRMTVRHLVADWGGRYLPHPVVKAAEALIGRLGLWESIVRINLGDIVTVMGQKAG